MWGRRAAPAGGRRGSAEPPAELTYYRDVEPILDAAGCHVAGGLAPWSAQGAAIGEPANS